MGKKVSNLVIHTQAGVENSYYARWEFKATKTVTGGNIKVGDLVTVKPGSTWYNGVAISSFVFDEKWYVTQVNGDRAVLGKNQSGTNNIISPINTKNLTGGSGSSSSGIDAGTLDYYEVKWYYDSGNSVWFAGSTENAKETHTNSLYSPPKNAVKFKVVVKPIAKTHEVGEGDKKESVPYWEGSSVEYVYNMSRAAPAKPTTPTVTIENNTITAYIENISDARTDKVDFQLWTATERIVRTQLADVVACRVSTKFEVNPGNEYRVRCRAANCHGVNDLSKTYSEYTDFSNAVHTVPNNITSAPTLKATSDTSVYVEWKEVKTATSYDIEYSTNVNYFDITDKTTSVSSITTTRRELIGLEAGQEYFFRVRSVNDVGPSKWSPIARVVIGKKPIAPTTWSSSTTVVTGESLTLYWVHNAQDGSSQTYADLELVVNGETLLLDPIKNSTNEEDKDKTSSYVINTSAYPEGTTILWRVRTMGVTMEYGEWSVQRSVEIYAKPTLMLKVIDGSGVALNTINTFPFYISALAGPNTQAPVGYHLSVTANETYMTTDNIGNEVAIKEGEAVYSKHFDTSDALMVEFSPSNINLDNNKSYTLTCVVAMNSGLTATASTPLEIAWIDVLYEPDVSISIDTTNYMAYIRPYCVDDDDVLIEGVQLSVYRREFDGSFTEIATGIDNLANTTVIDPHPALDYARYRIIATDMATGAVSYYDPPGRLVNGKGMIIQWDEQWQSYDVTNEDIREVSPWTGSMLHLLYDVDISDNYQTDVELVDYIGRPRPVSYYGTKLGGSSSWNTSVPKEDKETLYAIRRLANWTGDVYVRESSGSGYWASISVSYSINHNDVKVPVSFEVKRVEGGM